MLSVQQVTGSIVSCSLNPYCRAITKPVRLELLANVANPRAEVARPLGVFFIFGEQMSVGGEHRATAASVGYDRSIAVAKGIDVLSRQNARAIQLAGMRMQSATANLAGRRLRLASICFQHSCRRFVDPLKQTLGHAGFE